MIKNVKAFDASGLLKKEDYNNKIKDIEDKIPNLVTNTTLNAKINKVKSKISSITGLATIASLKDFKNNIPGVNTLVEKADSGTKRDIS